LCQIQFWIPLKNLGANWYKENSISQIKIIPFKIYKSYHKYFLKKYGNFLKGSRVLDFGCQKGEFIAELKKRGAEVWGVDFNEDAIKTAENHFGLKNVFLNSFDEFFLKKELPKFDIITSFEVIEHLDNPLDFIRNLKNLLKPGGKIILSTPCRERIFPNLAHWDFPPNHLTRWNKNSFLNLFSQFNFEAINVKYLERFKLLRASVNKFGLGLVKKTALSLKENKKRKILTKIIYLAARLKEYFLGTLPAAFLWLISRVGHWKGGTILIEFEEK